MIDKFYQEWVNEKKRRDDLVAYASTNHCDPGEHYWEPERRARLRYQVAKALQDALNDDLEQQRTIDGTKAPG